MNVKSSDSDMKTNNSNCDSDNKLASYKRDIVCFEEDTMAKSMPVNFSPAKFAFFYNDVNNVCSTEPQTINSFDRERFKNDKASFFRTDVLLSPKYRGKVNLFDSSFEDFETQLTKIDSIPIKSDESLDDIIEKRDSSDMSSHDTGSTLSAEMASNSNTPDHSIFTLVSPSKFMSRMKDNRLSVSSDSKVELMRCKMDESQEEDFETTPTSQSFHDVSEECLDKSCQDITFPNLGRDGKYSTLGTFNLDNKSPDEADDCSCLRRIDRLRNVRPGNLSNRFSKSQETYQLQSDLDDTSDPDASRKEDFDDESVAISLDPMDCNYDSTSLMSDSMENFTIASNTEVLQHESEFPNRSTSLSSDDADEDDVISGDLVSFVRNFDRQTTRDGRFQEGKGIKLGVEKIPNDDEFILGYSVQSKKKYCKKNVQHPTEEVLSPTKHHAGCKPERSGISCQHGTAGNVEFSPTSPTRKYTSVLSKNISLKSPLAIFALPVDPKHDSLNETGSYENVESSKPTLQSGTSPISLNSTKSGSPEPHLILDGHSNSDEEEVQDCAMQDFENEDSLGSNDSYEFPPGLTASQRMILADFKFGSQRGSREKERPSAARLAKRLYHQHGFKRSDITRHLSKRNSFALLVGEEFLKYFDFSGERLDDSLRIFLKNLAFIQEIPCDKDRIMQHFAHRYVECNPGRFENEALVHSLAYALLVLDNDLNNQTSLQKVTSQDFVENFMESQQNAGADIPDSLTRDFLHQLYQSIKNEPLELQIEETQPILLPPQQRGPMLPLTQATTSPYNALVDNGTTTISRNGLQVMSTLEKNSSSDSEDQLELKKGYIMRKCCLDANGRKTGLGRRGWKMFYAVLRDTTLFLYSSERASKSKKSQRVRNTPVSSKGSLQANSEGNISTPKKSIGNSLKDRVLGKLSRKSKTGSQESGIANITSAEEEDSGNFISVCAGDDPEDENSLPESESEAQTKIDSSDQRNHSLPRESKFHDQGFRHVPVNNGNNAICLLHSLATKATDYIKKSHVFRLHTVDRAQYLIQTSDMKECQDWMDCINVVAALNSAPMPNRDFNIQKWFDRPISNLECSVLTVKEQILQHERAAAQYEKQLLEYRKAAPEKGSRSRVIREYCHKENFLKFEIKRFKVYTKLLQYQLSTCPQLEPSLAETTIGEVEEPSCSPVITTPPSSFGQPTISLSNKDEVSKEIQKKKDSIVQPSPSPDVNLIETMEDGNSVERLALSSGSDSIARASTTLEYSTTSLHSKCTTNDTASESSIATQATSSIDSVMRS